MNTAVMPLSEREAKIAERQRWLRRQAMQIIVQLPEEEADALQVLDYARPWSDRGDPLSAPRRASRGLLQFRDLFGQLTWHVAHYASVNEVKAGAGQNREAGCEMHRD